MQVILTEVTKFHRIMDESFLDKCDPKLADFYAYWKSKVPLNGGYPARADICPEEMVPFLSNLILVERRADNDLYYRLVGTLEASLRGNDPTGNPVRDASYENNHTDAYDNYDHVLKTGDLIFDHGEILDQKAVPLDDQVLFLPLASDHKNPDMVIAYAVTRYARTLKSFEGR